MEAAVWTLIALLAASVLGSFGGIFYLGAKIDARIDSLDAKIADRIGALDARLSGRIDASMRA